MSPTLISLIYWGIVLVFLAFAVIVLIATYKMDLSGLISELDKPPTAGAAGAVGAPPGRKASLSRFQFLIFTFIVGGVYLALSIESGTFVDIPNGALGLMGISGGSFVMSKQISK